MVDTDLLSTAHTSLKRIQDFDPQSLTRRDDLGGSFELSGAVEPARKIIGLFRMLPLSSLEDFAENEVKQIEALAASSWKTFDDALKFDPSAEADPAPRRNQIINNIQDSYQPTFSKLLPYISFSAARTADFQSLAEDGRATIQGIEDRISKLTNSIEKQGQEVARVLDEARRNLAEQGVSQEAFHFQKEAELHGSEADKWMRRTVWWAVGLGLYALLTIFMHRLPYIAPQNSIETAQFIVGKVLVFGVIAFMLSLSARSYLSHRHNEIISRHRQNALMTYRSLVEAGATQEARDIILQQAAAAIYGAQDTGYVKSAESSKTTVTELIPRTSLPIGSGSAAS